MPKFKIPFHGVWRIEQVQASLKFSNTAPSPYTYPWEHVNFAPIMVHHNDIYNLPQKPQFVGARPLWCPPDQFSATQFAQITTPPTPKFPGCTNGSFFRRPYLLLLNVSGDMNRASASYAESSLHKLYHCSHLHYRLSKLSEVKSSCAM